MGTGPDAVAQIDHEICSTCTQCVAVCPQRALSWDGVPPAAYDDSRLPGAEQLEELLKQRRTVRYFRSEKIDRAVIEEVVNLGVYAPTNNYDLRAVVVDDRSTLEALDATIMRWLSWVYKLLYGSPVVFGFLKALTPALDPKAKVKMERGLRQGRGWDSPPAAVVIVVGDSRVLLSEASAQYALYNMILYAQARGIGSRINAAGKLILDRSRTARKRLGLTKHEHILGTLELGYPAVRFRNKVEGKVMPIGWYGRQRDG
jgi:nitroreductase